MTGGCSGLQRCVAGGLLLTVSVEIGGQVIRVQQIPVHRRPPSTAAMAATLTRSNSSSCARICSRSPGLKSAGPIRCRAANRSSRAGSGSSGVSGIRPAHPSITRAAGDVPARSVKWQIPNHRVPSHAAVRPPLRMCLACWRCRHGLACPGRAVFTIRRASLSRSSPPREFGSLKRCCHAGRSPSRKHDSAGTSPAPARRDVIWTRSGCEHVSAAVSTVVNLLRRQKHTPPGAAVGPRGGAAFSCAPFWSPNGHPPTLGRRGAFCLP